MLKPFMFNSGQWHSEFVGSQPRGTTFYKFSRNLKDSLQNFKKILNKCLDTRTFISIHVVYEFEGCGVNYCSEVQLII